MPTRTTSASASSFLSSLALLVGLAACGPDPKDDPGPLFPEDYEATYTEVRDCRRSGDHDLAHVRVLASPDAVDAYRMRDRPFPVGAVVLKEEHADETCTDLVGWTVMQKLPEGDAPDAGDWHWQRADATRTLTDDGAPIRCVSCHAGCGVPPDGYDWTCTVP